MDKEKLKEIAGNSEFIEGIYNYCDRWCERCSMTTRCSLFAIEKETASRELDMSNEAYWEQIGESFKLAIELLYDFAEEQGIDLDTIPEDEELIQKEDAARKAAKNHPAAQKSHTYAFQVGDWFKEKEADIDLKTKEWETISNLGLEKKPMEEAKDVRNTFEIIKWYQHQIYVKIMRALQGKLNPFGVEDAVQNDANGSAKVALLGISRSMAAWGKLLNHFPESEGSIFSLLVLLEQTKAHLEKAFPQAEDFVRPGFDD